MKSQKESMRLEEAGLGGDVLDSALAAFILEVSNNWQYDLRTVWCKKNRPPCFSIVLFY